MEEANQYLESGDLEQYGDGLELDSTHCSWTQRRALILDVTCGGVAAAVTRAGGGAELATCVGGHVWVRLYTAPAKAARPARSPTKAACSRSRSNSRLSFLSPAPRSIS
jgi:hypothetical protein